MRSRFIPVALALAAGAVAPAGAAGAIAVEGEAPERSNIPTAADRAASGGGYLKLATANDPPREGWYASYAVNVPAAGPYRLDAVLRPPATADRAEFGGSDFELAVGDGPFEHVAKAEPVWSALPAPGVGWSGRGSTTSSSSAGSIRSPSASASCSWLRGQSATTSRSTASG